MMNITWTTLNHLQIGRFGEYYAKMLFTAYGFDVYSSEVDDHGVDFVVKSEAGEFFEVQVKSICKTNYMNIYCIILHVSRGTRQANCSLQQWL